MFLFINLTHISSLRSVAVAVCPRSSSSGLVRSALITLTDNFVVVLYQKYAAGKKYAAKRELVFNKQLMCYNSTTAVHINPFLGR